MKSIMIFQCRSFQFNIFQLRFISVRILRGIKSIRMKNSSFSYPNNVNTSKKKYIMVYFPIPFLRKTFPNMYIDEFDRKMKKSVSSMRMTFYYLLIFQL